VLRVGVSASIATVQPRKCAIEAYAGLQARKLDLDQRILGREQRLLGLQHRQQIDDAFAYCSSEMRKASAALSTCSCVNRSRSARLDSRPVAVSTSASAFSTAPR